MKYDLETLTLTQTRRELCLLSLLASVVLPLFTCLMEFVKNEPTSSTCQETIEKRVVIPPDSSQAMFCNSLSARNRWKAE